MKKVRLAIKKSEKQFWLYINDQAHVDFFSHSTRVDFIKKANNKFDKDLEFVAEKFKHHTYGAYLWLFTSEFIRGEAISSLIRWHFIVEMIDYLENDNSYDIDKLNIETSIPKSIKKHLAGKKFKVRYKVKPYLISFAKYNARGWLNVLKSLRKNFQFVFKRPNTKHEGIIADINRSFTKHRYDNINKLIDKYPAIKFFSGQEHPLENIPVKDQVVFRKELSFLKLLHAIMKAMRISFFTLKNKKDIPDFLYSNLTDFFNLILWFDLLVFEKCVQDYLNKNEIEKIFHVSTLTKPTYRILMAEAKKRKIEFTLVASRTLMELRSSERLLRCDVKEYNDTGLPEKYIFKDEFSKKIFNHYPELKERTFIGGKYIFSSKNEINLNKPAAILLLFNHTKPLFYKLLNEVVHSDAAKLVDTVIFRCHPAFIVGKDEMQKYFPGNILIDNTGKDFSILNKYRTVTISGATTGALEAVQAGTIILWVPYIWDDGILMDDMMNEIGTKCVDRKKLKTSAEHFIRNSSELGKKYKIDANYIEKNFNTKNLISE
ncbi:MAG: hypothetical protein ACOCWW_02710, partial [Bacteroidota bacterium]